MVGGGIKMNVEKNLLIEIGTEELPPHSLEMLASAFAKAMSKELITAGFTPQAIEEFASPRRLALLIHEVAAVQPERIVLRRGPPVNKAYDQDKKPTALALGFAKSCGVPLEQLSVTMTDKGECLIFSRVEQQSLASLLPNMIATALNTLPIAKPMRWGNHKHRIYQANSVASYLAWGGSYCSRYVWTQSQCCQLWPSFSPP